ncbi:hypothetical protein PU197_005390 [Escherichia coli]|nr:hypothetical protein [Escherichia coli]
MNQERMRLLLQTKAQNDALRILYGFGEEEALRYIEGLLCTDKVKLFGPLALWARTDFRPWESEEFVKICPEVWPLVDKVNHGWWRWLEQFNPYVDIVPHRYLIDPFANVWDAQKAYSAYEEAGWGKRQKEKALCAGHWHTPTNNTETGYINYQFRKTNGGMKDITRSRLVAYRSPHLVWREYMREKYGLENFLGAPISIIHHMQGLDWSGNMIPTGFYHRYLNNVEARQAKDGRIWTYAPKGPSGAGVDYACSAIEIDHINHDRTDDRPTNLSITDRMGNLLNSRIAGFRNRGYYLQAAYNHSVEMGVLPAVKIIR